MAETKFTKGPWQWRINRLAKQVQLCGGEPRGGFGRYDKAVMDFVRYGMNGASPRFWRWSGNTGDHARADELAVAAPDRDHHADWFAFIDHPDAHLIAAAPEMYEALETDQAVILELLDHVAGDPNHDIAVVAKGHLAVRANIAALAKARGETAPIPISTTSEEDAAADEGESS